MDEKKGKVAVALELTESERAELDAFAAQGRHPPEEFLEMLLERGIGAALHNGLPPKVWAEIKRARAQRLSVVDARNGTDKV